MAGFTRDDVAAIAALANLELDDAELDLFARQLGDILAYAEEVQRIDTTDGPRHLVWKSTTATSAAAVSEPSIVSRAQWGADESYRFDSSGKEVWPPAFSPTQKLIVHHTAGQNDDPNPASTVRAISPTDWLHIGQTGSR